jgi:predicted nuclease of restriction endonuclease-like RecB superfamily
MNLKLEELRKRLLEPVPSATGAGTTPSNASSVYRHNANEIYMIQQRSAAPVMPETSVAEPNSSEQPAETPKVAPNSVTGAMLQYVEQAAALKSADEVEPMDPNGQYQLAQAVARVFEQTKVIQDRFLELNTMFEPIWRLGEAAARSLEPLKTFHEQLTQLAQTFEPMRAFQVQLAQLAQTFEPMKGLQLQLAQISEAFQIHLGKLTQSLEPAKEFQKELSKLAHMFDPVGDLEAKFEALVETFKGPMSGNGAAKPVSVQH